MPLPKILPKTTPSTTVVSGQPAPASAGQLAGLMIKGYNALASIKSKEGVEQSSWTDPAALESNGWSDGYRDPRWHLSGLIDMLIDLGIVARESDIRCRIQHKSEIDSGKHIDNQNGYCQVIKVEQGFVLIDSIWKPDNPPEQLNKYSDILYLTYSRIAAKHDGDISDLKYILFHNIQEQATWAAILAVLARRGQLGEPEGEKGLCKPQISYWPGLLIEAKSDEASLDEIAALLATPLGKTLAWLLIQHKEKLGKKEIVAVNIFKSRHADNFNNDFWKPSLLFRLGDKP